MLPVRVGCLPTCNEALRGVSQFWDFLKGLSPSSLPSAPHMYQKAAVVADFFSSISKELARTTSSPRVLWYSIVENVSNTLYYNLWVVL